MKYLLFTSPHGGWFPSLADEKMLALSGFRAQLDTFKKHMEKDLSPEMNDLLTQMQNMLGISKEQLGEESAVQRPGVYQWHEAFNKGKDSADIRTTLNLAPEDLEKYDLIHVNGCVLQSTPILTKDGITPIEKANDGDLTFDSDLNYSVILQRFDREYDGEVIEIKVEGLPSVTFTPEHPIWIVSDKFPGWTPAAEVTKGMRVVVPRLSMQETPIIDLTPYNKGVAGKGKGRGVSRTPNRIPLKHTLTEDLAEFFGWFVAEGNTSGYKHSDITLYLGKHEETEAKNLKFLMNRLFNLKARIYHDRTALRVVASSPLLARFLRDAFGLTARTKRIPEFILNAKNELVAAFLKGYFKGDGYLAKDKKWRCACFRTASPHLAFQTYMLLLKLGLRATITQNKRPQNERIEGRRVNSSSYIYSVRSYDAAFLGVPKSTSKKVSIIWISDYPPAYYPRVKRVQRKHFKGKVYNLKTTSQEYCLPFRVHNCGADVDLVPSVKAIVGKSSIPVIFNLDYAIENWQLGFPRVDGFFKSLMDADFIFAVEPGQQALLNFFLHHVGKPARTKVNVPVIPHPCDVQRIHKVYVSKENRLDRIMICFHRYDKHIYIPSIVTWDLEAYHPAMPSKVTRVPVYMGGIAGSEGLPFHIHFFDGFIVGKSWFYWIYELAHSTIGYEYYTIHSHSRFPEECACLGIPCVGTDKAYSIRTLHPYTCHSMLDFAGMRRSLQRLMGDEEFYAKCEEYAWTHVQERDHEPSKMKLLFEMDKWLMAEGKA